MIFFLKIGLGELLTEYTIMNVNFTLLYSFLQHRFEKSRLFFFISGSFRLHRADDAENRRL